MIVIKYHGGYIPLVVENDIQVEHITFLSSKIFVGNFLEHKMNFGSLHKWIQLVWNPLLGYGPNFPLWVKGWIKPIFRIGEDASMVLRVH